MIRSLAEIVDGFVENPLASPLGNTRMRLHRGTATGEEIKEMFKSPHGCVKAAGTSFRGRGVQCELDTGGGVEGFAFGTEETAFGKTGWKHPGVFWDCLSPLPQTGRNG